jgi:hypothetical protein
MLKVGSFVLAGIIILAGVFWAARLLPEAAPTWEVGFAAVAGFVIFALLAVFWVLAIEVLLGTINALLEVSSDTERLTELLAKGLGAEDTQRLLRHIESVLLLSDGERRRRGQAQELADLVQELEGAEHEQHWNEVYPLVEELIRRFPDADATLRYQVQRDEVRERALEQDLKATRREAEQVGAQGNWALAFLLVERLERRYPGTPALAELRQQVARERESAEAQELGALAGRVEAHIAAGDWTQAQVTAERLARRFPHSPQVVGLMERIRALAEQERQANKVGLETAIKDLIQERRWPEAVEKTRLYLELYPDSPETKGLRDRLPWLEANAEGDVRDQLLDSVKQAMNSRRYDEAYTLASEFLERYPESKEAEVIRRDLDQLRERARQTPAPKPPPTEEPAAESSLEE